jgi:hypothetical protein
MSDLEMLKQAQTTKKRNWPMIAKCLAAMVVTIGLVVYAGIAIPGCGKGRAQETVDQILAKNVELIEQNKALKEKIDQFVAQAKVEASKPQTVAPAPTPVAAPIKPQVAVLAATPTPAKNGTNGVLIGTLYHKSKRAQFKDEVTLALAVCAKNGEKLQICFAEVGDTSHSRFETSAIVVDQGGLSQARVGELSVCLHNKLPGVVKKDAQGGAILEDGNPVLSKVATSVVDTGTGRYKDKGCYWE